MAPPHSYASLFKTKWNVGLNEMETLSKIAETQPHAVYAAFTHGLFSKWNYLLRVTDWEENQLDNLLDSLERSIQSLFIPALTGQHPPGEHIREMASITRTTWWPGSDKSYYLSKDTASCLTTNQCPTR